MDVQTPSLKAWRFSLDNCPADMRAGAWRENMRRLCLPVGDLPVDRSFFGSLSYHESPLGMEFALVDAAAHEISGRYLQQPEAIWLIIVLEGKAQLIHEGKCVELASGDIAYGPCRREATMSFPVNFRLLHIRIPRLTLSPRVLSPLSLNIGYLRARSGIDHVFAGMLRALSETIEDMTASDLRPVELSLTEFLISSLREEQAVFGLSGPGRVKAAHFHSICQSIETMLSDPELNLKFVATENGVSTRYLQKLFTSSDTSFSHYLRSRRLERCKADLINPIHTGLSISEICFRWGFNGSAHFSRVFRNKYGVCPREFRRNHDHLEQDQ
tara:strand:+ start:1218 stop:2201 length:984 start_codon:yes stop_codon:yes gene_type:complete